MKHHRERPQLNGTSKINQHKNTQPDTFLIIQKKNKNFIARRKKLIFLKTKRRTSSDSHENFRYMLARLNLHSTKKKSAYKYKNTHNPVEQIKIFTKQRHMRLHQL